MDDDACIVDNNNAEAKPFPAKIIQSHSDMIGLAIFHNFPKIGQLQTRNNIHIRRKTREIETTAKCQMELHKLSSRDYARSFTIPLPSSFLSFEALLGDRHLFTFVIHTLAAVCSCESVSVSLLAFRQASKRVSQREGRTTFSIPP